MPAQHRGVALLRLRVVRDVASVVIADGSNSAIAATERTKIAPQIASIRFGCRSRVPREPLGHAPNASPGRAMRKCVDLVNS